MERARPHAGTGDPLCHAVVSVLIHFAPSDLEGGWDEPRKEQLGKRVVEILETVAGTRLPYTVHLRMLGMIDYDDTVN